ncbi:Ssl1-like-domain-containing protein [Xylariales sp. AK1849]|nr:Ssl1-like-domain-containing protein [Xylariales sp. AK1849]
MADSDGEFQADDGSDEEFGAHQVSSHDTRGRSRGDARKSGRKDVQASWENVHRTWDAVTEGEDGTLQGLESAEAKKRARLMKDTTPLQRGIIRHLVLVLDLSFAMLEKDMLPSRHELSMAYARDFVREYFEQNPISQLAIVGMRDGIAVRISDMSGNPADHLEKLGEWVKQEPQGSPSLQNALEMCRGALFHTPSHGTREVLIVYGALMSSDPGDIHDTITAVIKDRIRISVVGLAAQVAICAELCAKTNSGDESAYAIAMNEQNFRELLLNVTTPPATRTSEQSNASLLMMGFPSRKMATGETINYCACHNRPTREGYECTRCGSLVCRLPAECPGCGLTLILSTHLARSYHHLFPLRNWVDVPWSEAGASVACYACLTPFPDYNANEADNAQKPSLQKGLSESSRYGCEVCGNHFCIDCDLYAHEVLHNCPGCQSDTRGLPNAELQMNGHGEGRTHVNEAGAMEIDT